MIVAATGEAAAHRNKYRGSGYRREQLHDRGQRWQLPVCGGEIEPSTLVVRDRDGSHQRDGQPDDGRGEVRGGHTNRKPRPVGVGSRFHQRRLLGGDRDCEPEDGSPSGRHRLPLRTREGRVPGRGRDERHSGGWRVLGLVRVHWGHCARGEGGTAPGGRRRRHLGGYQQLGSRQSSFWRPFSPAAC